LCLHPRSTASLAVLLSLSANPSFAAKASFSVSAPALTVTAGQSATAIVQVVETGGPFNVSLKVSGLPAGVTATLQPATTSSTSILTVTAAASAAAGSHKLTVQGSASGMGNQSGTVMLTVKAATPALAVNAISVAFGPVDLNTTVTQSLTLSSTGTATVTVSAASISGAGFSFVGLTLPLALSPSQTATLYVVFDPATAGAVTGKLSLTSNSSTGSTTAVSLTGTGVSGPHEVDLSWNAPDSSLDPVAGYLIYRAPGGTMSYQQLDTTGTVTNYIDATVQNGTTYNYIVRSVDASGQPSSTSNIFTAAVPW